MNNIKRPLCLLMIICLLSAGIAAAETKLYDPVAVVSYDRNALVDWTPSYHPNMPGILLELSHPEGILSVAAVEKAEITPEESLSGLLDRAAETLVISDAQLSRWEDPLDGDGRMLSYSYSYPDGDEQHLFRIWTASRGDMLIELTIDTWGEEAAALMDAALSVFIEEKYTITFCKNAWALTATLTDLTEDENGLVRVELTGPDAIYGSRFHPILENAVILFPNPDDPSLFYPVAPDMASLTDAIFTYEDNSDSPAVFYSIIENGSIIYMEYSLMQ